MKIQQMAVHCKNGHVFIAELVVQAPTQLTLLSLELLRCPDCDVGSDGIYVGPLNLAPGEAPAATGKEETP